MGAALVLSVLAPRSLPDATAKGARVPADDAKVCVGSVDVVDGVGFTGAAVTELCAVLAAVWLLVAADDVVAGAGLGVCDADLEVLERDGEWWVVGLAVIEVLGNGVMPVASGLVCVALRVLAGLEIDDVAEIVAGGMRVPLRSSNVRRPHRRSSLPTHWRTLPCIHGPNADMLVYTLGTSGRPHL